MPRVHHIADVATPIMIFLAAGLVASCEDEDGIADIGPRTDAAETDGGGARDGGPRLDADAAAADADADADADDATDADGATDAEVVAPPVITTLVLAPAVIGEVYRATLTVSGGAQPLMFSATGLPPGLALDTASTPAIAGIATSTGTFQVDIAVTAADGARANATFALQVRLSYAIVAVSFAPILTGVPIDHAFETSNGTGPNTFMLAGGTVPPGLGLGVDGHLAGTPTQSGLFSFTVVATDAAGHVATLDVAVEVISDLAIDISAWTSTAAVLEPFADEVTATGGLGTYTWSVTAGAPPAGVSFTAVGAVARISGPPSTEGTTTFELSVSDGDVTRSVNLSLEVIDDFRIVTTALSAAITRVAYSANIEAAGGPQPYTFSIASGAFPPGLSLSSSGEITGAATQAGTYNFVAGAVDAASSYRSVWLSIHVGTVELTMAALPPLVFPYSAELTASGGVPPYTWSVSAGALPPGWTLVPSAAGATLSGDAFVGAHTFSIAVLDAVGNSDARALTLSVPAADRSRALWPVPDRARPSTEFNTNTATVTDLITHLDWVRMPAHAATFAEATSYCASLAYGGHSDWRVPEFIELVSVLDDAWIETLAVPFTQADTQLIWSSTPALPSQLARGGRRMSGALGFDGTTHSVYCARSEPIADRPRYSVVRGSSVDTFTGLMWTSGAELVSDGDLENGWANGYCDRLNTSGFTDWHVPSLKVLLSANGPGTLGLYGRADLDELGIAADGRLWPQQLQYCVREPQVGCGTPVADLSATPTVAVTGQLFTLDASNSSVTGACAPQYTWSIARSSSDYVLMQDHINVPTVDLIAGVPGVYAVTVAVTVDGAQAFDSRLITVTQDASCALSAPVNTFNGGSVEVFPSGGTPPYAYLYVRYFAPLTDMFAQYSGRGYEAIGFTPSNTYYVGCATPDEGLTYQVLVVDSAGCSAITYAGWSCGP